jgi:hypothetical protein
VRLNVGRVGVLSLSEPDPMGVIVSARRDGKVCTGWTVETAGGRRTGILCDRVEPDRFLPMTWLGSSTMRGVVNAVSCVV